MQELDQYRYDTAPGLFSPDGDSSVMDLDAIKALVEWKLYVCMTPREMQPPCIVAFAKTVSFSNAAESSSFLHLGLLIRSTAAAQTLPDVVVHAQSILSNLIYLHPPYAPIPLRISRFWMLTA